MKKIFLDINGVLNNNKQSIMVFILVIFCGCNNEPKHKLIITDTTIYYDSMTLINESP